MRMKNGLDLPQFKNQRTRWTRQGQVGQHGISADMIAMKYDCQKYDCRNVIAMKYDCYEI